MRDLEILYGLGGVNSNSKPSGRSEKFRPRGRNFFDLPEGLEFEFTPPNRIDRIGFLSPIQVRMEFHSIK